MNSISIPSTKRIGEDMLMLFHFDRRKKSEKEKKPPRFLVLRRKWLTLGAAVLAAGVVIVKIIGALFKIPLANILGETGNADFNNAYNIYAVLLTISTAGLPVALSKMISEAKTLCLLYTSPSPRDCS